MPRAVLHVVPRDIPKLEVISARQDALDGPLGQLARVVLQLIGQHSAALRVQLLTPVNASTVSRIPLVQSFQVHKLDLASGALNKKSCRKISRVVD